MWQGVEVKRLFWSGRQDLDMDTEFNSEWAGGQRMYQPEIFDFSYSDINVPAKAFFQQFSSSIPEGSTAMYSSSCLVSVLPSQFFCIMSWAVAICTSEHNCGQEIFWLWQHSMDVTTGDCLYLLSKVGLLYLSEWTCLIRVPASSSQQSSLCRGSYKQGSVKYAIIQWFLKQIRELPLTLNAPLA